MRGDRVRTRRLALGWTQQKLAEETGLRINAINGIETGRHQPTVASLTLLAVKLQVSADWLLGLVSEPSEHLMMRDLDEAETRFITAYRSGRALDLLDIALTIARDREQAPAENTTVKPAP